MMILNHNFPVVKRLGVSVGFARSPIDNLGQLPALTVDVGASVERVFEHGNHIAVPDRRPFQVDHPFAVRRAREMKLIRAHGEMYLPRAAKLPEAGEDHTNDLLKPPIRVKSQSILAAPEVPEGDANAKFTAPRLGAGGVEHARAENAKLELADAALHPEQQSIIGPRRVIDAVKINHARLDQATQFQ